MKKNLILLFALFATIALTSCGGNDAFLKKVAEEANKQCPKQVDEFTTMDSIIAQPENKLKYFYTFSMDLPQELTPEVFSQNIKAALAQNLKNNQLIKPLLDKNITFVHQYNDKNGKTFTIVEFTPEDYKNLK